MQVTQCDNCKTVASGPFPVVDFTTNTKFMVITAHFIAEDQDYCPRCAFKMATEAGRMLWDKYKRTVDPLVKKDKDAS